MVALHTQVMAAHWRFAATALESFRPWLEPGVLMTEQLAEQMLAAGEPQQAESPGLSGELQA